MCATANRIGTIYTDKEFYVCYRKLGDIDRSKANLLLISGYKYGAAISGKVVINWLQKQ